MRPSSTSDAIRFGPPGISGSFVNGLLTLLTVLRQSYGIAVAGLYITEVVVTRFGSGYYIDVKGSTFLDDPEIYADAIDMRILGLGLSFTLHILEIRKVLWRTSR